jgi:hypothetical protein
VAWAAHDGDANGHVFHDTGQELALVAVFDQQPLALLSFGP